jgi:Ca-activated chloride channel homolog
MTQPAVEPCPIKPAVRSDDSTTLDVLLRIVPPALPTATARPKLNLGLVLDRSGSMAGDKKLDYAKEAAVFAIRQLLPTDRVSVTIFDTTIETIVPNCSGAQQAFAAAAIAKVQPGSSTDLHGGWLEGTRQVQSHFAKPGLNRVLLLSDGQANQGETDPDTLATKANAMAREGISTSTLGVGDDYNENLMEAMARSGDGNYYYIESPAQLPAIFQAELSGLMATVGHTVSLGIEPGPGTAVTDVFNDFDPLPTGRWKLPNLVAGVPLEVAVRLKVPAGMGERELARFRLAWNSPDSPRRQSLTVALKLPSVPSNVWDTLGTDPDVQEHFALLQIARGKKLSAERLEAGDFAGSKAAMGSARAFAAA